MQRERIERKAMTLLVKMDSSPWSGVLFVCVTIGFMIAAGLAYNSVVPVYH